jgi:hypothetical protein
MRGELDEVRRTTRNSQPAADTRGLVVVQPPAAGPSAVASAPAPSAEPPRADSPEEAEYRLQESLRLRSATYERAFDAEPLDPEWHSYAEDAIQRAATDAGALAGVTARCKSSLCRVDYSLKDPAVASTALQQCVSRLPWQSVAFNTVDTQSNSGHAYVVREGFDLPPVDAPPAR